MKTLLKLLAALVLVALVNGCASTCCNSPTSKGTTSSSKGPTINGYVDTSVGTKW